MKKLLKAILVSSIFFTQINPIYASNTKISEKSSTKNQLSIYTLKTQNGYLSANTKNSTIYINEEDTSDNDQWIFKKNKDGYYIIYSFVSGQCLTLNKEKEIENSTVVLSEYKENALQHWKLRKDSNGSYFLSLSFSSNYALWVGKDGYIREYDSKETQKFNLSKKRNILNISKLKTSIDNICVDEKSDERGIFHVKIDGIESTGTVSSLILEVTPKNDKSCAKKLYFPIENKTSIDATIYAKDFNYESGNYSVKASFLLEGLYESEIDSYTCMVENSLENLKKSLEKCISSSIPSTEDWQIYLFDLQRGKEMNINSHKAQSASMIKMWVMGAVYKDYDRLIETYGKNLVDHYLSNMISWSQNWAWMGCVGLLGDGNYLKGTELVNEWAQENGYKDVETQYVDSYNYCSAKDAAQLFKDVYDKKFEHSQDMLQLFLDQKGYFKIPAAMPEGIVVANKTGDLLTTENDTALVYAPEGEIIMSIMSTGITRDPAFARENLRIMARMIYDWLNIFE
ncbi:MAG: serine hydrolase [Bacillota bacterium]|nr:serine hydrolase [Bacillota bacterium]